METILIEKFFSKQCTPHEAAQVALYLKANPSVLEKYISTDEWNNIVCKENFPEELRDELWQAIKKKNKARIISLTLKRFAAAASVILIIAAAFYLYTLSGPVVKPLAQVIIPKIQKQKIVNTSKKTMRIVLEDSSVVMLSPASYISYTIPFQNNKREILLEGEAKFHVAKNKLKPFTVYAGALATTALGTVFSVRKNNDKNNIIIKLFKGKVVIRSTDKNLKGWNKDVYLLPGEQMNFNTANALLTVEKNTPGVKQSMLVKSKINHLNADSLKDELRFANTDLPVVLNKLSVFYKVRIQYDSIAIDTMNFTGTVSKSDSLPVILKAIGNMNELDIIQNENGFIIKRQ